MPAGAGLADLGVPGGIGELDRTLLEQRLLDELYLSKATVAVGRGERLLGVLRRPSSCSRRRRFGRGIVVLKYAPRR
jgi:dihydrofolate reductase